MARPQINQIYTIVNGIFNQMTGQTGIKVVDTNSLIAMGKDLENSNSMDIWLNSLSRRIGLTFDSYRPYKNKFSSLYRNSFEWGAAVQKITAEMPVAVDDSTYNVGLLDGQSVDQWIISNPKVHQKIFDKETPYSFFITVQRKLLKEAFLSESAMGVLISTIFGQVSNKIEFVLESLARMAVANFVLNLLPTQQIHLVTMYNASHVANPVTTQNCLSNAEFLRFMIAVMENVSDKMEDMTTLYNSGNFQKFTPKKRQEFYILSDVITQLQTVVQYQAFHAEYVNKTPSQKVSYWQANAAITSATAFDTITTVKGTVESGSGTKEKTVNNLIAVMFDYDGIGTFRQEEDVLTTPVNARARYYNTFWFEKQLWFNDMDENGVAFFLD